MYLSTLYEGSETLALEPHPAVPRPTLLLDTPLEPAHYVLQTSHQHPKTTDIKPPPNLHPFHPFENTHLVQKHNNNNNNNSNLPPSLPTFLPPSLPTYQPTYLPTYLCNKTITLQLYLTLLNTKRNRNQRII